MKPKLAFPSIFAVCALLALAPMAHAQGAIVQGYGEDRGIVQQVEHASTTAHPPQPQAAKASSSGAKLPFTGLDLAIVVGLGGVLAGTGVVLRRSTRPRRS